MSRRTPSTRISSKLPRSDPDCAGFLPTVVGVIAVLGLIAVLIWKHRFLPSLIGVLVGCGGDEYVPARALPDREARPGVQGGAEQLAPSGHTTFAAAAGAALFLAAPRFLRPTVALCAALATCPTGASTIINGWHRPVDVVTAILVTAIWTVVGYGRVALCASGRFCGAGAWRFGAGAVDDDCDAVPSFCAVIL